MSKKIRTLNSTVEYIAGRQQSITLITIQNIRILVNKLQMKYPTHYGIAKPSSRNMTIKCLQKLQSPAPSLVVPGSFAELLFYWGLVG